MNINQQSHNAALNSHESKSVKTTKRSQNGFDELGIAPSLLKAINRLKFENPTPIQKEAIPVATHGDDVIALAQTGSGKTLAFGIPMLQRLSKSKRGTALVLVPTRELAIQVEESLQAISRPLGIRSAVLIGGASMSMQINILKKNTRVVIATPGRLMDHIDRGTINLSQVETFVLDEADRMLDMGFVPDIKQIMKSIPEDRQTMLFSATMPKPIEKIAKQLMENPVRIAVDPTGATPAEVSQEIFMIKNTDKTRLLDHHFKQCTGPVLVFTRTKRMATKLKEKVNKMGFTSAEIHSDRSQGQRRNALEGFKRGRYQVLIATDIAARGIDVKGIELVVNYDMPANPEDYVHRIGRTGRAGKSGHAISFATSAQKNDIRDIERYMKAKLTITALPTMPSEKNILQEAIDLGKSIDFDDDRPQKRRSSRDRSSSERRFSREGSSNRRDFKRSDSNKSRPKRFAAKDESSGSESKRYGKPSQRKDFKKSDSTKRFESKDTGFKKEFNKDDSSSNRRFSRDDSPQRGEFKKSGFRKDFNKDDSSSKRRFSRDGSFKRNDFKKSDSSKTGFRKDFDKDDSSSKRRFSRDDSPQRSEFKKSGFRKDFNKDDSSSKRKFSRDDSSKRRDFKKSDSKKFSSNRSDDYFKPSTPVTLDTKSKAHKEDFDQNDSSGKKPFWSKFANGKKRSVGQGSGRKRKSKK